MSKDDFSDLPSSVRSFRRCPGCNFDWATGDGVRACSLYDCAYLPAELRVACEWCGFNFATDDGHIRCDHETCPHALQLKANLHTYLRWTEWVAAQRAV